MTFEDHPIIFKIKQRLLGRGHVHALRHAQLQFQKLIADYEGCVPQNEFIEVLRNLCIILTPEEHTHLFKVFDCCRMNTVCVKKFLVCLIGGLNPRRSTVVHKAFAALKDETGCVSLDDLNARFVGEKNPLLRSGKSPQELKDHFFCLFNATTNPSGTVAEEEFQAYYTGLSAAITKDDFFEAVVLHSWGVDNPHHPRLESTVRDWKEGSNPLDLTTYKFKYFKDAWSKTLYKPPTTSFEYDHMKRIHPTIIPNPSVKPSFITTTRQEYPPYSPSEIRRADAFWSDVAPSSPTGNRILDAVREKILTKTESDGLHSLARVFRSLGKSRLDAVSAAEFEKGMLAFGVQLTALECDRILSLVGTAGHVRVGDFLKKIRGTFVPTRKDLVVAAFKYLAKGRDALSPEALKGLYNPGSDPKYAAGLRSREDALLEFFEGWESASSGVTLELWVEYFADVSCVIPSDAAFEVLLRSMWNISKPLSA